MSSSNWLHNLALGGCLAASLFVSHALGQHPDAQQGPAENQDAAGDPGEQPAGQAAIEAPGITPPIAPADPGGEDHDGEGQPKESREPDEAFDQGKAFVIWSDTLAQWIMAALGVVATGISIWAVCLLQSTLGATRDAIREAEKTTEVANLALEETRLSNKRQLRAYMNLTSARVSMEEDGRASVRVIFKNGGQTPAYHVTINNTARATTLPVTMPFEAGPQRLPNRPASRATTGAGADLVSELFFPNPFDTTSQGNVSAGRAAIFTYGKVTYKDIFGDPHTAHFRYMYASKWGGSRGMDVCDDGNESD